MRTPDPMEQIRPELRQAAAEMRNAYVRAKRAWSEGDQHMAEVRNRMLFLRSQGVSIYRIAKVLGVSYTFAQKVTRSLQNRT